MRTVEPPVSRESGVTPTAAPTAGAVLWQARASAAQRGGAWLDADEAEEVLAAAEPGRLVLGGWVDAERRVLTLWRGDLVREVIHFSSFNGGGGSPKPDFGRFSVEDCGQTIRLGDFEAASDAVLSCPPVAV